MSMTFDIANYEFYKGWKDIGIRKFEIGAQSFVSTDKRDDMDYRSPM